MNVNRALFFDNLRMSMGSMDQRQVDGISAILDAAEKAGLSKWHTSYVLANVYRETGGGMYPIKETVYRSHKDQNPSDATVKSRLTTAWRKGQLPWVKSDYWSDGWFGRGQIQITHKYNYDKFGISDNPSAALDTEISAQIAVDGMSNGSFTGKRLGDYDFPDDMDNEPKYNPRRIVNGSDGSDGDVAEKAHMFYNSIVEDVAASEPMSGGLMSMILGWFK